MVKIGKSMLDVNNVIMSKSLFRLSTICDLMMMARLIWSKLIKNSMSRHLIIDYVIAIAVQGSLPPPGVSDYDIIIIEP